MSRIYFPATRFCSLTASALHSSAVTSPYTSKALPISRFTAGVEVRAISGGLGEGRDCTPSSITRALVIWA
jgi:hypothetical protein